MLWSLLLISLIGMQQAHEDTVWSNEQTEKQTRITSQSSNKTNGDNSKSEKAVDGDENTCAHTQTQQDPWWRIDLQDIYDISFVILNNTFGPPSSDISHVQVFAGNSLEKNGTTNPKCKEINNFQTGKVNILRCDRWISGRYVTVFVPGQRELVLCEVRIFGKPKACWNEPNEIQTGITSQSSDHTDGDNSKSEKAIDRNKNTCAHTQTQQGPWWRIDLQDIYDISCVSVYNKRGPPSSDMRNVQIFIGNSLENNGTTNPKCKEINNFQTGKVNIFRCDRRISGRYVTVFVPEQKELVLCEVRIHGTKKDSPFVLIQENKTWEDALDYCRSRNMDLASILDEEDQEFAALTARSATTSFVWLGLHYTCILEAWFWVADHHFKFSRWAPEGKMNKCDVSGAMETSGQHQWSSQFDYNEFNFICERCV